ncbi:unnamed protein product, partial [Amoebophrya sp. A120]
VTGRQRETTTSSGHKADYNAINMNSIAYFHLLDQFQSPSSDDSGRNDNELQARHQVGAYAGTEQAVPEVEAPAAKQSQEDQAQTTAVQEQGAATSTEQEPASAGEQTATDVAATRTPLHSKSTTTLGAEGPDGAED